MCLVEVFISVKLVVLCVMFVMDNMKIFIVINRVKKVCESVLDFY